MTLRIRELRESRGIPQWQMAEALGITAGYLSLIEHGHRQLRLTMTERIAAYLGVQPSDLVTIEREPVVSQPARVDGRRRTARP